MSTARPLSLQSANVPNTLQLACRAEHLVTLTDLADLPALQALAASLHPVRVVGQASNLVLPDTLGGLVIRMALRGVQLLESRPDAWVIEVAAGENWHQWVVQSLESGWPGLENLALIPGTVGAAPIQNIGAYGLEVSERIEAVRVWDFLEGGERWLTREACRFGYRDSLFKHPEGANLMVLAVRFLLPRPWCPVLGYADLHDLHIQAKQVPQAVSAWDVFRRVVAVRQAKLPDPALRPNVGSFFKNPVVSAQQAHALQQSHPGLVTYAQADGRFKLAAGWLIDHCQWKGRSLGRASVHDRQALVLINDGGATAQDVLSLAQQIAADVTKQFGVDLEIEPGCW
jgi:UDP-N-acetylmuramate dehydrogenase